jgi:hypothetical protein
MALWVFTAESREEAEALAVMTCVKPYPSSPLAGRDVLTLGFGGWDREYESLKGVQEAFRALAEQYRERHRPR